jgi:hypothetical protein
MQGNETAIRVYPLRGSAYNPTARRCATFLLFLTFSLTVTLLANLASTGLRLLSGALGAAPAAGIKLVSVLTLVKTSCVKQLDATLLWLLDGSVYF